MEYKTLSNGQVMPMLGLGTYQSSKEDAYKSVLFALKNGYDLIDTAQIYKNEDAVGQAIKDSGRKRGELYIVTKVNFKNFERCRQSVEESMNLLQLDYIDLVLLHWPYNNYYAAWRDLEKLYEEGLLRSIGVSNFEPDRLMDLVNFNKIVPQVNQIETNLLCQRKREQPWHEKLKVHQMAYTPLGQNRRNEMFALPSVTEISEKYNKTKAQVMLRFLIDIGCTVIPKSVHEERVLENIDVFDFRLTAEEIERLKREDTATALVGTPADPFRVERSINW